MIVSWYGRSDYKCINDEQVVTISGGKWDGLYKTIEAFPQIFDEYDYIWLPDDDIEVDCATINNLFQLMAEHKVDVGQPSLSWDSFFSIFLTLNVPNFILRYTNFVEIMVPCFHSAHLKKYYHEFKNTMTGWGLDWVWAHSDAGEQMTAAIFDLIKVRHTRPVGVNLHYLAQSAGQSPDMEMADLLRKYKISDGRPPFPFNLSLQAKGGLKVTNFTAANALIIWNMRHFWAYKIRNEKKVKTGASYIRRYARQFLYRKLGRNV